MNIKTQIVVGTIVVLAVIYLFSLVRKNKLEIKYAFPWVIMAGIILILDIFPEITVVLAHATGVGVAINILFFMGFCFFMALTFTLSVMVSNLSRKSKILTQKIGLLEERVRKAESCKALNESEPLKQENNLEGIEY